MGKPYSDDLRERVVAAIEAGHTRVKVAELYNMALSTVGGIIKRKRETGSVSPDKLLKRASGHTEKARRVGRAQIGQRWPIAINISLRNPTRRGVNSVALSCNRSISVRASASASASACACLLTLSAISPIAQPSPKIGLKPSPGKAYAPVPSCATSSRYFRFRNNWAVASNRYPKKIPVDGEKLLCYVSGMMRCGVGSVCLRIP
jgi:hypothetical protein